MCTCCRQYPGAATGRRLRSSYPAVSTFPEIAVGSACTSSFSRLARRSLALRPAHSRRHLYVTGYTEGFSHFVTSMTAPVASGWSVRRVGLAPTGKRRLLTAHANSSHSPRAWRTDQIDPLLPFPVCNPVRKECATISHLRRARECPVSAVGRRPRQLEMIARDTVDRGFGGTCPRGWLPSCIIPELARSPYTAAFLR